jgi:hypothetical protein
VNTVLEGQPAALAALNVVNPNLAKRARRARNMLDDLSTEVAKTQSAALWQAQRVVAPRSSVGPRRQSRRRLPATERPRE